MIEVWKKYLDKRDLTTVALIDLSKAFGTITHSLLIAKLEAHRFFKLLLSLCKVTYANDFKELL